MFCFPCIFYNFDDIVDGGVFCLLGHLQFEVTKDRVCGVEAFMYAFVNVALFILGSNEARSER